MEDSHRVASSVEAFDWLRLRTPVVSYIGALDRLGSVAPSSAGYVHRQSCLRSGRQLPFLRLSAEILEIDTFIEHGMGWARPAWWKIFWTVIWGWIQSTLMMAATNVDKIDDTADMYHC